jgi:DNA-binding PadR family transcriptional regulator
MAHILNDIIGPYARVSNGRLYPLLARLEEDGLIEVDENVTKEQRGERPSRCYRITEAGRKRFHALMMDTTSNPGEYQRIFHQKVPMFAYLSDAECLHLIEHYINYCQAHVWHLTTEGEDLATGNHQRYEGDELVLPATLDVMKHMADQWRLEIAWAQRLRARARVRQAEHLGRLKAEQTGDDRSEQQEFERQDV